MRRPFFTVSTDVRSGLSNRCQSKRTRKLKRKTITIKNDDSLDHVRMFRASYIIKRFMATHLPFEIESFLFNALDLLKPFKLLIRMDLLKGRSISID